MNFYVHGPRLWFLGFCSPPKTFFPTQGNGSEREQGKDTNPMGFFHSNPMGREWEPGNHWIWVVFPAFEQRRSRVRSLRGFGLEPLVHFNNAWPSVSSLRRSWVFWKACCTGGRRMEKVPELSKSFVALYLPHGSWITRNAWDWGIYRNGFHQRKRFFTRWT